LQKGFFQGFFVGVYNPHTPFPFSGRTLHSPLRLLNEGFLGRALYPAHGPINKREVQEGQDPPAFFLIYLCKREG